MPLRFWRNRSASWSTPPVLSSSKKSGRTLVVLRHGDDRGRGYLSEQGVSDARFAACEIMEKTGVQFTAILTSKEQRAVDTATELGKILGATPEVVPWLNEWYYAIQPEDIKGALARLPETGTLVLVSHQPQVSQLTKLPKAPYALAYFLDPETYEVVG